MKGLLRLCVSALIGAWAFVSLPREGVLSAAQEIISFVALLMAGLLPAMILTATILRGSAFSTKRVEEYGGALKKQLHFWAVLFGSAAMAALGIVGSEMFSAKGVKFTLVLQSLRVTEHDVVTAFVTISGMGLGIVIQRLWAAYRGLTSLLDLNVKMSKAEALVNDRTIADALDAESSRVAERTPYAMHGG